MERVAARHDPVDLERGLVSISICTEVTFAHANANRFRDLVDPVLGGTDEGVARGPGAVVQLGTRSDEETASGALAPREPVLEEGTHAGLAARLAEGGDQHGLDELVGGLFDDRDLERFLRAEVREQAGLGEAGGLGEAADRETGDTDHVRELERAFEDRLARLFAFAHAFRIERPFVLSTCANHVPGMARERLDKLLVDRGLAGSRERARALIMSGSVLVGGHAETKPGTMFDPAVEIALKAEDHPYVSRGALKLVKGLDTFGIDPTGLTALDIGASTGGFTDVLLRRGAAKVYAIDVGYGQLAWPLRQDPRVVVLERQNARSMDLALVPEPCDLAVIDTSFISLTLILPRVAELLRPPAGKPIVALVKPQFEVGREQVGKGGVVRDEAARRGAVEKVRTWATAHGFTAHEDVESPITGPAGNVEYLLLLRTA